MSNPLFGINLASEILHHNDNSINNIIKLISKKSFLCQKILTNFSNIYINSNKSIKIDLIPLTQEVLLLAKTEIRGISQKIISSEKEIFVKIDPSLFYHILFNLIINASQAIRSINKENYQNNNIEIFFKKSNSCLTVSVKDDGPGIDPSIIDKISDPFYTTKQNGSGMGLSICQNLLKKINSNLVIKNNQSKGSIFSFQITTSNK